MLNQVPGLWQNFFGRAIVLENSWFKTFVFRELTLLSKTAKADLNIRGNSTTKTEL
jgi:hypothetical protein